MELKQGTAVYTAEGADVGRIDRVVLDPQNGHVAGVVVRKGFLLTQDKVIPMSLIAQTSSDHMTLRPGTDVDLKGLADFEETHYIPIDDAAMSNPATMPPGLYWYPPAGMSSLYSGAFTFPVPNYDTETEKNIPEGTVALSEGAKVMSGENTYVGNIERVFVDEKTHKVTHFLISQGLFLKDRKAVPIRWVKTVHENTVQLAVGTDLLNRLPAYKEEAGAGFTPGVV